MTTRMSRLAEKLVSSCASSASMSPFFTILRSMRTSSARAMSTWKHTKSSFSCLMRTFSFFKRTASSSASSPSSAARASSILRCR